MKLILSLLSILLLTKECDQKKNETPSNSSTTEQVVVTEDMITNARMQTSTTVYYEASTRGFYEKVWVTKDSLYTTKDRANKDVNRYACSQQDWDELMLAMKEVTLGTLNDIDIPSKAFQYDGAAMATLKIQEDDAIYSSPIFDHGNPPKQLSNLVKKVLYLKEMAEKQ
ncbi:hypothetical protein RM697_08050 [Ichthyenterobacterium sp. W332]|uniref:Lipoprotein n=1 Tax=Microcosmobacter mediterraneus TaxID=3075607 RepID=A0ABU2YK99_9FLAO|nr:hypothetical protein [Ichthyenterobacterium sp. W332]MDT0558594.1 hypothetical protein [Ichthyenterobacterium sp. W332]